jgi:Phycobilisome Linker polypeptide
VAPVKVSSIKLPTISEAAKKAPTLSGGAGKSTVPARAVVAPSAEVKFCNPKTARYVFQADSKGHGETAFDLRVGGPSAKGRANANGTFRNMDLYTSDPVWARPNWSPEDADVAVRTVFRNILGNSYLLEEEVAGLATEISGFKSSQETKEFVRAFGLSEAYRSRYLEPMSNMRFVELNFKHFLGRAPKYQAEISTHIRFL